MRVSPDLAAWLGDRGRRQSGEDAAQAFAERWSRHEFIQDMRHALDALEVPSAEAVLAAAEQMMSRSDGLTEMIRELIPLAAANPFFRPPLIPLASDIATGFILYDEPAVTVSVAVTSADALAAKKSGTRGPSSITFSGLHTAFRFLKAGGVTLSLWEAPPIDAGFTGSASGRCRLVGHRKIRDGEQVVLDGRRQSFVIEHVESDMLCLQAAVHAGSAPLRVEYDSRTHEYVGASSTDESASRVQIMVSLLRVMDRRDAVPVIETLLFDSPHFYTRWQIMRELLALDAEAALPSLKRLAAEDPHGEVRALAAQTLELFFGEDETEATECHA